MENSFGNDIVSVNTVPTGFVTRALEDGFAVVCKPHVLHLFPVQSKFSIGLKIPGF